MNPSQVDEFARAWVAAWNALDLDAVLAHFADDARFTSPKAAETMGTPTVAGKPALRAYWEARRAKITAIRFTLDRTLWDPQRQTLAVLYTATINGRSTRAVEIMRLGPDGLVVEGEAMYGAPLD